MVFLVICSGVIMVYLCSSYYSTVIDVVHVCIIYVYVCMTLRYGDVNH